MSKEKEEILQQVRDYLYLHYHDSGTTTALLDFIIQELKEEPDYRKMALLMLKVS